MPRKRRAVVLLSGGPGSAVALALALDEGFEAHAVTLRQGSDDQKGAEAARHVARQAGDVRHMIVDTDGASLGGSRPGDGAADPGLVGVNVAYALACAEAVGASDLFVGTCASSGEGAVDWGANLLDALEHRAQVAARAGAGCSEQTCRGCAVAGRGCSGPIRVRAPLRGMSRSEVRRLALSLGIDLSRARE